MLRKLLKAAIGATLLNKTARYAFIGALIKSVQFVFRPATLTKIGSFFSRRPNFLGSLFKGIVELALLRSAQKAGFSGAGALSALAAIMLAMMKRRDKNPGTGSSRQNGQIIDLDDYTILDDRN
jgi:hypothetical protein